MTDEALEQRLRAWYRSDDAEAAPVALRASVADIAAAPAPRTWLAGAGRAFALLAAAALATLLIVSGAFVVGTKFSLIPSSPSPTPGTSPLPSHAVIAPPSPESSPPPSLPAQSPTPTPSPEPSPVALIAAYHGLGDTAEILTLNPNTGEPSILGTVPVDSVQLRSGVYGSVAWSTDRQLVTVSRVTDGTQAVAQLDLDGHNVPISVGMESAISPQGDRLAGFGGDQGGGTYGLVVTDLHGNVLQRLNLPSGGTFETAVSWTPDGSALIVSGWLLSELPSPSPAAGKSGLIADTSGGDTRLFIVPLDGSHVVELGKSLPVELGHGAMSPDQSTVVAPTYCSAVCPPGLVSVDVSSGAVVQLTTSQDDGPTWSPDGTRIAFERTSVAGRGIWVMDADGSNLTRLTTPPRPDHDHSVSWSPDGTSILFSRGVTTQAALGDLYVVSASGGDPRLLLNNSVGDW